MKHATNRPAEVLNDWLNKYGYDKHRHTGKGRPSLAYVMLAESENGITTERWVNVGHAPEVDKACLEGFRDVYGRYEACAENGIVGDKVPTVKALLVVAHGEAELAVGVAGGNGPSRLDDLPEHIREQFRAEDPDAFDRVARGAVPTRSVSVVTPEGTATEVTMYYEAEQPLVEIHETWVGENGEGERTGSIVISPVEGALTKLFAFLTVVSHSVRDGRSTDIHDLFEAGMEHNDGSPMGRFGAALMLNMVAFGIENNLFTGGDDEDNEL